MRELFRTERIYVEQYGKGLRNERLAKGKKAYVTRKNDQHRCRNCYTENARRRETQVVSDAKRASGLFAEGDLGIHRVGTSNGNGPSDHV
jgi:hypothetical protein